MPQDQETRSMSPTCLSTVHSPVTPLRFRYIAAIDMVHLLLAAGARAVRGVRTGTAAAGIPGGTTAVPQPRARPTPARGRMARGQVRGFLGLHLRRLPVVVAQRRGAGTRAGRGLLVVRHHERREVEADRLHRDDALAARAT